MQYIHDDVAYFSDRFFRHLGYVNVIMGWYSVSRRILR